MWYHTHCGIQAYGEWIWRTNDLLRFVTNERVDCSPHETLGDFQQNASPVKEVGNLTPGEHPQLADLGLFLLPQRRESNRPLVGSKRELQVVFPSVCFCRRHEHLRTTAMSLGIWSKTKPLKVQVIKIVLGATVESYIIRRCTRRSLLSQPAGLVIISCLAICASSSVNTCRRSQVLET